MDLLMTASYCPLDSRANLGPSDAASLARTQGQPTEKKEPCDWCDGDR
jgi:hypothetical protein